MITSIDVTLVRSGKRANFAGIRVPKFHWNVKNVHATEMKNVLFLFLIIFYYILGVGSVYAHKRRNPFILLSRVAL